MANVRTFYGMRRFGLTDAGARFTVPGARLLACLSLLLLAACTTGTGETYDPPPGELDEIERMAYERTGDVRVYFYIKPRAILRTAGENSRVVEQREVRYVLVNKGHSFYRGEPDYRMAKEERLLYNNEMHDLLVVLRDQFGFFRRGNSVNILNDDPFARADREPNTGRMIAVQQIIDGKVNTSYFSRRLNEEAIDAGRAKSFNDCQAIVMEVVAKAIPRGTAGQGEGDTDALGKR